MLIGKSGKLTIFNQRLAGYLMIKGFVLLGIGESHKYKDRNVFFFNDSIEAQDAVKYYIDNKQRIKV